MSEEALYDAVIVGAGVSGLCLARALLDAGVGWSILLIDGAQDDDLLRTLSFWTTAPTPLDALVRHRWKRLVIADRSGATRSTTLRSHTYQTLFFADLQRTVKDDLRADLRHRIIDGRATSLSTDGERVRVSVGDEVLHARWAFDSRFRRASFSVGDGGAQLLWQHFHGLVVRSATDIFDPSAAVFLDFRGDLPAGTAFAYLLPFSAREALAELVTLEPLDAEGALRRYLATVHGVEAVEVVDREAGASPMTEQYFEPFEGPRIRRIGIPAGMLKASTGYALTRILDDSAAIVRSLRERGHPMVAPPSRRIYRFLDGVFLTLWARWPARMPSVFSAMFARVPADRVLRFLDERASPWDLLSLIARLPVWPFFRALLAWFARRLPGSRRRLNSPTETRR
jgi:lycopene beta-cyclase